MKKVFLVLILTIVMVSGAKADGAHYNVWLESCEDANTAVVKAIREATGLGLKEAKDLANSAPCWVLENGTRETAETLTASLNGLSCSAINYLVIDDSFSEAPIRHLLEDKYMDFSDSKYKCVSMGGLEKVKAISVRNQNLSTLRDIDVFTRLQFLDCSGNQLTSLDLTVNWKLKALFCYDNPFSQNAINDIIDNLPETVGTIVPFKKDDGGSTFGATQIAAAKAKGWETFVKNSDGQFEPYNEEPQYFDANGAYYGPATDADAYSGAYYTGRYVSPFKTFLGKTDTEIQEKLDQLWNHYFKGDNNQKVYYETGSKEAYILDVNNNDVRSEGMSYGMMLCVQTNHKEEFDKLWHFAKSHMWHNPSNGGDGYFSWQCNTDGSVRDQGCAPDGDIYFMMSLLFAANRWHDEGYMKDAQAILKACWKGNGASLFSEQSYIVVFQPTPGNNSWSDPSYSLPAYVDLFSRWSTTNQDKWKKATSATRDHLYKSSNTTSGLFSDYNNFDGTPHSVSFNSSATKYMYDAMRCAMNFGMDYYLFGADAERQTEMAQRLIDFFESDGYKHARFNWDGSNPSETYTLGEKGCNAVACYALIGKDGYEDKVWTNLSMAWNAVPMTGQYRYYDGMVHYLAMLHLCGAFKIWKPITDVYKMGDANGDHSVTITDAVGVVNKILGNPSPGFIEPAADVNRDGNITITDAVGVVNIILSGEASAPKMELENVDDIEATEPE